MQPQGRSHSCIQRSTGIVASQRIEPSPPATILLHPQARGSKMGLGLIRSASRVRCRVSHPKDRDMRPHHAARRGDQGAVCTTAGSRHVFGCVDDRRNEERQHHQEVLRTRESPVLFVQPRKNSKRARPCVEHTRTASKRLERSCLRRWAHRAQLARVVISCGKQKPSAWAEETKKKGAHTQRKVLNCHRGALPCPEHAQ